MQLGLDTIGRGLQQVCDLELQQVLCEGHLLSYEQS